MPTSQAARQGDKTILHANAFSCFCDYPDYIDYLDCLDSPDTFNTLPQTRSLPSDWATRYWGQSFSQLQVIKEEWDPCNIFK